MRNGRISLWFIGLVLAAFLALAGYHYANQGRYQANEHLLNELKEAPLTDTATALGKPGIWPQWRGPLRDGVSRETGLLTSWPKSGPSVLWQINVGLGYCSVAVADGRLFTQMQDGDNEVALCLDPATGKENWRVTYPGKYKVDPSFGPCPRATPTVDGDRVYIMSGSGLFQCLDAATGNLHWKHEMLTEFNAPLPQWGVATSPLIEGDLVITQPGGTPKASVVAFNKKTGVVVWQAGDDVPGYSSPVAATLAGKRQLVVFTGASVLGLTAADGKILWRYPWQTSFNCNIATPICRGDEVFISSGYGKGCAVLKISEEQGEIQVQSVYEHNLMCNHFSSSVFHDDHLFGFSDQVLTCMDFRTGKIAWTKKGYGRGSLLIADGQLFVMSENGQMLLAPATVAGFQESASFRFSRRRCWCVPVIADGKLYLRDEEKLVCLAAR